jgi:hypothetical protein
MDLVRAPGHESLPIDEEHLAQILVMNFFNHEVFLEVINFIWDELAGHSDSLTLSIETEDLVLLLAEERLVREVAHGALQF